MFDPAEDAPRLMAKGISILTLIAGFTDESPEGRAAIINSLDPDNEVENQIMTMVANIAYYAHRLSLETNNDFAMALALMGQVRAEAMPTKEEL